MASHKNVDKCLKDKINKFMEKNGETTTKQKPLVYKDKENSKSKRKVEDPVDVESDKKQVKSLECTDFCSSAK